MFQISFTKFAKCLASVSMSLCVLLFVVGCSNKPDESDNEGSVSEHKNLPNIAVTEANLGDFLDSFYVAISGESFSFAQEKRAKQTEKLDTTIFGSVGGKMLVSGSGTYEATSTIFSSDANVKITLFDYSNGGDLFLGGGWTFAFKAYESITSDYEEFKANGTIDFRGHFSGSIVFKNFYYKYDYNTGEPTVTGSITIKSNGEEIDVSEIFGLADILDIFY